MWMQMLRGKPTRTRVGIQIPYLTHHYHPRLL